MKTAADGIVELEFREVLAVLQGWLGQPVEVGVHVGEGASRVAALHGELHASPATADGEDFEFRVGSGTFALSPHEFGSAALFTTFGQLNVALRDDDGADAALLNIVGPADLFEL